MYQVGVRPSYATGFAQWPGMSEYPQLWEGLVAAYAPFLGMTGSQVFDLSGKRNHGTLVGTAHYVSGHFGPAILLDGNSDYVNVGKLSDFGSNMDDVSFVIWVKSSDTTHMFSLMGSYNDGLSSCLDLGINSDSNDNLNAGYIYGYIRDEDGVAQDLGVCVQTNTGVTDGNLHCIVIVLHLSAGTAEIYVDGIAQTVTIEEAGTPDNRADFAYDLTIGARNIRGALDKYFNGIIDMPIIYNRGLYASEIAQLYWNPFCMFEPSLSVAQMYDYSGAPAPSGQVIMIQMTAIPFLLIVSIVLSFSLIRKNTDVK